MKWTVNYAARSHLGLLRENNEDNLLADGVLLPPSLGSRAFSLDGTASVPAVFAVCDGMGGEAAGEIASRLTAEAFALNRNALLTAAPSDLEDVVQSCVRQAHGTVGTSVPAGRRSGSTLALAVLTRQGVRCFNSGDSRIFCSRRGRFWQVTHDHNVWADQLRAGTPLPAYAEPDYRLTRCVGIGHPQPAESYPPISGSCRLLLCSDGLTDMVSSSEISAVMQEADSPAAAADRLLHAALQNGGQDNVTILAVDIKRSWF